MLHPFCVLAMSKVPFLEMTRILMREVINKQIIFQVLVNLMRKTKSQGVMRVCVSLCVSVHFLSFSDLVV